MNEIEKAIKILQNFTWIPVNDRLPEDDREVLITFKSKDEYDDTIDIAISSYREEKFAGQPLGYNDWKPPFEYFRGNYEITAWMFLPEPYIEPEN